MVNPVRSGSFCATPMSLTDTPLPHALLVFTEQGSPIHDLVASTGDAATDEISRSLWQDFRQELLPRLAALSDRSPDHPDLKQELHALRGTSSQFGLFLLEILLFAWEKKEPDPLAATARYLPGLLAIAPLSLDAIEADFPHLKSGRA